MGITPDSRVHGTEGASLWPESPEKAGASMQITSPPLAVMLGPAHLVPTLSVPSGRHAF